MQIVSCSEVRESFKAVLDRMDADAGVTVITRRRGQGAVVMLLDTYKSQMETVYVLRSPAAAASHLQRRWEERWVAIPDELIEPVEEPWTISTEHGETPEP